MQKLSADPQLWPDPNHVAGFVILFLDILNPDPTNIETIILKTN